MEKLRRKVYDILREYRHMKEIGYMPYLEMAVHTTALENYMHEEHNQNVSEAYNRMSWFVKIPLLIVWGKKYLLEDLDCCVREITESNVDCLCD